MIEGLISCGSFTSDGNNKTLKLRSDVDMIEILNYTQWAASNNGYGFKYTWNTGMGSTMLMEYHPAGDHTAAVNTTANAITVVNSAEYPLGSLIAVTAGTNATRPVFNTGTTTGLTTGTIVRVISTDQTNLNGLDFSIDAVTPATNFRLANTLATAPGIIAGASGYYRIVAPNVETYSLFKPATRFIANITRAASAVVTTLVDHGYVVGQKVRFRIPSGYGMTELDGLTGNITAIATSNFTVDIDSTGFSAFTFPTYASTPFDYANVNPVGDSKNLTTTYNNVSRVDNQGYIGVVLTGGTTGPAGNIADVIYWRAFRAENIITG